MKKLNNFSIFAALSIVISVAMLCSTLFVGVAGAQLYPISMPFGYDGIGYPGFGGYGYPGFDGYYGMPFGSPAFGDTLMPYGLPSYAGQQMPYGAPSYAGQQMPYGAPSYAGQQTQVPYSQPVSAGGSANFLTIPGLEGLTGFMPGENKISLAVIPVTQQNNQMGFQVIGFAISGAGSNQATVYSLKTPMAGIIDPSQNTLQVDLSNIETAVNEAGFISSSQVYDSIRSDPRVVVIDVDMTYQGTQGSQTMFNVNSVSIIPPDGRMQAFQMQQPTQLIIDSQSMRLYMVAFPQMIDAFGNYYGATYSQVLPIVYAQPIPILAPIFVPFLQPFPIFFTNFVSFNPFFFGSGFTSFFSFNSFGGRFPIHDKVFGQNVFNQFAGARGIGAAGISQGIAQGNRLTQPSGVQATSLANIGVQGGRFTQPSGLASAGAPGVSATSGAGTQSGIASVRAPGVSISSGAGIPSSGVSNIAGPASIQAPSGFANVRAPGVSIGSGAGTPSFTAGNTPSFSGLSRGIGAGTGASLGAGLGGSGMRLGGGRR